MNIKIFDTPVELADAVAVIIMQLVNKKAEINRNAFIAVSGGSTPGILFQRLSGEPFNSKISWKNLQLFWADERCVPPVHPENNYGMTKIYLLDKINIPDANVHRIKGEEIPSSEASAYAFEVKYHVPVKNLLPSFDLTLLGMGSDGHTASLFPGGKLMAEKDEICGVAIHPQTGQNRISLTEKVLNNSAHILFMVTGKDKSGTLNNIIENNPAAQKYPASKINPSYGILEWYVDKEAII